MYICTYSIHTQHKNTSMHTDVELHITPISTRMYYNLRIHTSNFSNSNRPPTSWFRFLQPTGSLSFAFVTPLGRANPFGRDSCSYTRVFLPVSPVSHHHHPILPQAVTSLPHVHSGTLQQADLWERPLPQTWTQVLQSRCPSSCIISFPVYALRGAMLSLPAKMPQHSIRL